MRIPAAILFLLLTGSCTRPSAKTEKMQELIDSLKQEISQAYRPGFGEIMTGIQMHHAKLWFAGLNKNWPLARFEVQEIQEGLQDIQTFCSDRLETKSISMIFGALDSVAVSIENKNPEHFKTSYVLLTAKCNSCHRNTQHGFNVVTIPAALPVTNQDFKPIE